MTEVKLHHSSSNDHLVGSPEQRPLTSPTRQRFFSRKLSRRRILLVLFIVLFILAAITVTSIEVLDPSRFQPDASNAADAEEPPPDIPSPLVPADYNGPPAPKFTMCTTPGKLALTFDDGPSTYTTAILNILKTQNVKATFFLIASQIDASQGNRDNVLRTLAEGHEIGSHSWGHPEFTKIDQTQTIYQIDAAAAMIKKITGKSVKFFRFPYGYETAVGAKYLAQRGYNAYIHWDMDARDWSWTSTKDYIAEYTRLLGQMNIGKDSIIALNHDTTKLNSDALSALIDTMRKNGWTYVKVSECLGLAAYE